MPPPGTSGAAARAGSMASAPAASDTSFTICTVEDAFAHTGCYILRPPVGPLVPAVDLHHVGCMPGGARPLGTYPLKSRVLVCRIPMLDMRIIIGGVPRQLQDARLILPDSLVLRSCVGLFQDPMHYTAFSNRKSSLGNMSAGRPADSLPGDWGSINELGLTVYLGKLMVGLRASDLARVDAFWGDDLLRLTGYNMEVFTAGAEETKLNDEGEYNEVLALTSFPWEGMGKRSAGSDATRKANGRLKPGSEEAAFEPEKDDQLMMPRLLRFRGYLGDIEREMVCMRPADADTETHEKKTKYHGLLEIVKHVNGAYAIRSAKEIILEKYALIPVPKKMFAAEDPKGDNRTSYKASNLLGAGNSYEMPEFIWGDETNPNIRSAQLADHHAWFFSRYTTGGLVAHKKDWYYPDETELDKPVDRATIQASALQLKHRFMADLPVPVGTLVVDDRPGHSVRYYASRSVIHQLDDGSIIIGDGYGSQIVMKGGSIFLECVGDVWAKPGRNFVAWAPHDAILRAGNSADITASKKDVRIKAERNMHILAGNSEEAGGILLESKANGDSRPPDFSQSGERINGHGITFKAAEGSIHAWAKREMHLGLSQEDGSVINVDAGKNGSLFFRGQQQLTRVLNGVQILQAVEGGGEEEVVSINRSGVIVSTPMQIGGTVIIAPTGADHSADLIVGGNLIVHESAIFDGSVATNGGFAAADGAPFVGELDTPIDLGPSPDELADNINGAVEQVSVVVKVLNDLAVEKPESSPGNEEFKKLVGFSCRSTVEDYKLDEGSFLLFESGWQQILRTGGGAETWDEPVVKGPNNEETRPHPGQDAWDSWQAYGEVNSKNFDDAAGKAKNRTAMSEQGNQAVKKTLKSGYVINVQE